MEFGRFGKECYRYEYHETTPMPESTTHPQTKMIVGRGTPFNLGDEWMSLDAFGGNFKSAEPHLWMDFNNPPALTHLHSNWLNLIVIDCSTWRYMKPIIASKEWHRILAPGGKLMFEAGAASYCLEAAASTIGYYKSNEADRGLTLSQGFIFTEDNPCHLTLTAYAFNKILRKASEERQKEVQTSIPFGKLKPGRQIIPASSIRLHVTSPSSAFKSYKHFVDVCLYTYSLDWINSEYEKWFTSNEGGRWGVEIIKDVPYVVDTRHDIRNWIQVTKIMEPRS
jgi:hypothetical protein